MSAKWSYFEKNKYSVLEKYKELNKRYRERYKKDNQVPYPYITWEVFNEVNSKTSLAELKQIEEDIEANPQFNKHLNLYCEEKRKLAEFQQEYPRLEDRFLEIINYVKKRTKYKHQQKYNKLGILKKFFSLEHQFNWQVDYKEEFTRPEKDEIEKFIKITNNYGIDLYYDYLNPYATFRSRKNEIGKLKPKYEWAYKTCKKIKWIKRYISKTEKKANEKAMLAAYKDKGRELADQIKVKLKEQTSIDSSCPYCGQNIGIIPHCDHIYPLSKGGFSTSENMVYICSECNLKKTNLTLTQFAKKYNLPREKIEKRLEKLGKAF